MSTSYVTIYMLSDKSNELQGPVCLQPGASKVAVTTDPEFFEEHADSLEFWTPGSPAFPLQPAVSHPEAPLPNLEELLNRVT